MEIYEIDARLERLVDPETGELLDFDTFAQLQMERAEKVEEMALWYKNISAEAKAIKEEADALLKRGRSLDSQAERLKEYIGAILGGEKFSTHRCVVSFHRSSSLEVKDDQELIEWAQRTGHEDCIRYKPPEVAKSAVTALLKSGVEVPCAQIKSNVNVRIK